MAYGTGALSPNEPRPKDDRGMGDDEPNPSEQEIELAKQIEKLFQKAAKARKRYDRTWVENYKFYRGQQMGGRRPTYKSREVINMIFRVIQGQTSVMMDTRPTVGFLPQDPADLEFSEILNQVFEADWERNGWMMELAAIILDGHLYSVGIGECTYTEDDLAGGKAGIKWVAKDPMDIYPDPDATDCNKESEYIIDAKPWDLDKIKKKYAGHKYVKLIKPDLQDFSSDRKKVETLHVRRTTDLDIATDKVTFSSGPDEDLKDKVLVVTAYLKPSDTEEVEQKDEQSGECLYILRRKYPNGRKVVKINNFIFEDGPLDYDDMMFPFQRYVNAILPREFYGIDELENLKGPQMVFNKMVNFALDVLQLMGNPVWLNPTSANVDSALLTNAPGLVVEFDGQDAPRRAEGVQLQPWVFQLIDRMEKWFNDTAGDQDVTRGINPTGVTANAAIENLLDAAQKRVKQKIRFLDNMMQDFGKQWVSRCMQFYTVPQIFRLTDKEGVNKYFKFHVEDKQVLNDDGSPATLPDGSPKVAKVAIRRDYVKNDLGQMVPSDNADQFEVRGEMDVRVNTVSGLPFSKAETEQRVLNLFDRQIIDAEEVLKRLEYPNAQLIISRMKQVQAEAAQAQPQQ